MPRGVEEPGFFLEEAAKQPFPARGPTLSMLAAMA